MELSFSSKVKAELCQPRLERKCCALAEAYGVLLYCSCFTPSEIRIITASDDFAQRLPRLFKKAFGIVFDSVPEEGKTGKRNFVISDGKKIRAIYNCYGSDVNTLSLHINFGVIEEECCRASFIRGAFFAGGSVTDPEKRFHLELATTHYSVSREAYSVLLEMGFTPKESERRGNHLLYFKRSEDISDLLTTIGASTSAMSVISAKIENEMSNKINRNINCDTANADKVVAAAQAQLDAIRRIDKEYGLDALPEKLQQAALLRIANPEGSLSDLAVLSYPPVSKSCLSHRLKRLMDYKPEDGE